LVASYRDRRPAHESPGYRTGGAFEHLVARYLDRQALAIKAKTVSFAAKRCRRRPAVMADPAS
jgi:hypothetical protein